MADHVGAGAAALAPLHELIRAPCARRRAAARRRHDRAGAGQGQDDHRPALGLCPRRPTVRPGPDRRRQCSSTIPATAVASIPKHIWPAMPGSCRPTPTAASAASTRRHGAGGAVTEALCWAHARRKLLRARRPRPRRQGAAGTARRRGGPPDRRHLRPRARDQRPCRRRPARLPPRARSCPWSARSRSG